MLDAMDFVLHVILDYSKCSEVRRLSAVPVTRLARAHAGRRVVRFGVEQENTKPNRMATDGITHRLHAQPSDASCTAWRGMEWAMRVGTGRLPAAAAVGAHRHVAVRQ
jgi:hypothetical protein